MPVPDDEADALRALLSGPCQCDHSRHPDEITCENDAIVIRATIDGLPWWLTMNTAATLDYARRHHRLVGLCAPCALGIDTEQLSTVHRSSLLSSVMVQLLCIQLGALLGYIVAPDRNWLKTVTITLGLNAIALGVRIIRDHRNRFRPIDGGPGTNDGSHERIDNP